MLNPPEHQVAGHKSGHGNLGPLTDSSGLFYKPLQTENRGIHELNFYKSLSSESRIPIQIRSFFPIFHGTKLIPSSNGSSIHPHLILDDLLFDLHLPSVIDLKIGSRTWFPSSPENYFRKCLVKDRETTSNLIGFRISGLQINDGDSGFWRPSRDEVRRFDSKDVSRVLRLFVSSNPVSGCDPDCAFASSVYGGLEGVLAQLRVLKVWFEEQSLYHFCSASVLIAYERSSNRVRVRLIDFAHVMDGDGVIDHNFLGGLCSLIKFISDILMISTTDLK